MALKPMVAAPVAAPIKIKAPQPVAPVEAEPERPLAEAMPEATSHGWSQEVPQAPSEAVTPAPAASNGHYYEDVAAAEPAPQPEPEPSPAQTVQPDEEPRPQRRGWWQRRFGS